MLKIYINACYIRHCEEERRSNLPSESVGLVCILNAQCARLTASKRLMLSIAQASLALLSLNRRFIFAGSQ